MTLLRWNRLPALGVGSLLLACGGGGGGGTGPCTPGLATHLTKTGGDARAWYGNHPPPTALSVNARKPKHTPVSRVSGYRAIQYRGSRHGGLHRTNTSRS